MSNKVKINIALGETKHPMIIDADDEPLYREAGRLVCSTLTHYKTEFRGAQLPPDYLMAFTAMDIAVRYLRQNTDSNAEAAAQHLEETLQDLNRFLDGNDNLNVNLNFNANLNGKPNENIN